MKKIVGPIEKLSKVKKVEFKIYADENVLGINEYLYKNFRKFHNCLFDYLEAYLEGDINKFKNAELEIDRLKQIIIQIIKEYDI